jgi:hypothetical protein
MRTKYLALAAVAVITAMTVFSSVASGATRSNGTTLAGYKTLDICAVNDTTWRYSGEISVWNEGAIDTVGLQIVDFVEYKTGTKFVKAFDVPITYSGEIAAGTTLLTATVFPYSIDGAPLSGVIRNNASITILNHSAHLNSRYGPNPKATYTGTVPPPPCAPPAGCVYTQGYWGNKPDVVWPSPYDRTATFYLSGQTWQQVLDTPVNVSQGYYQLAHQYIAALLNQANGAPVPSGIQDTLDLATAWFQANDPSATIAAGSGGTQKDWAAILDSYNNGLYPGGPAHCGDEV